MKTRKMLSPLNDFAFSKVFGSRQNIENTRAFLKTLLDIPEDEYDTLTVRNPILKRIFHRDKMGIVDLKLTTKSGKIIHIEVQVKKRANLKSRILYYAARMVTGQLKRGEDYQTIHQVISILICDHILLKEEKSYINRYQLRNENGGCFTDLLELVILELPKLPKTEDSTLWPWLKFFKCKREEDYEMLAINYPVLAKAIFSLRRHSLSDWWEEYKFERNLREMDERALLQQVRMDGLEEGEAKGKLEIARNLKTMGDSPERIQTATGLSPEEIAKL